MDPHPLKIWMDERHTNAHLLSKEAGIPFRAIYQSLKAEVDPRLSTMLAIEKATKKAVTVQKQANWFKRYGYKS